MRFVYFKYLVLVFYLFLIAPMLRSQYIGEYSLEFEAVQLPEAIGLHSFSIGTNGNEVLLIGGRLDGLHRRQPFAAFDSIGHNTQLIVINISTKELWKAPINHLDHSLFSQLKATNHCFTQFRDSLFLVGGYGIDDIKKDHVTFPYLTVFSVSKVIEAVKQKKITNNLFVQQENQKMAVTGGQLNTLNDVLFLAGGHRFDGQYNPINRPTFIQKYTDALVRFRWKNNNIEILSETVDSTLFHKRDFNLLKVHTSNDNGFLLATSGVFQYTRRLPWMLTTRISPKGIGGEVPRFRQFFNQYDCADFVVYDSASHASHAFLLGGISQYYMQDGTLIHDDQVPFVSTVSRLLVTEDSSVLEYKLPVELPALQGAGAQFVPVSNWPTFNGNLLWKNLNEEKTLVGYVIGGIQATERNIFWINDENESKAISTIYKVYFVPTSELPFKNSLANFPFKVWCEPNGKKERFRIYAQRTVLNSNEQRIYHATIKSPKGKVLIDQDISLNNNAFLLNKKGFKRPGSYEITVSDPMNRAHVWKEIFIVPEN
jgi:hypothetical protein